MKDKSGEAFAPGRGTLRADPRVIPLQDFSVYDIGGYPTIDGGTTRWGLVYRSAASTLLNDEYLACLDELGVRAILDLRHRVVAFCEPGSRRDGVLRISVAMKLNADDEESTSTPSAQPMISSVEGLRDLYVDLLDTHAQSFGAVVNYLTQPEHRPALLHCTTGKDRTGLAVALILELIGVPRAEVRHDHALMTRLRSESSLASLASRIAPAGIDLSNIEAFFHAPGEALGMAFAYLDSRYGSVEGYLERVGGVEPATVASLRALLVEALGQDQRSNARS